MFQRDDRPLGIALRAADCRMSSTTAAMCLLCESAQAGADVSLFTAKRASAAGAHHHAEGHAVPPARAVLPAAEPTSC
ncbi:FBP domain-containing protein [Blastococcus atacamensis]|uniref:FBP domain-containing protein n=1 Tax=Blastococcus atacamensis TaxID=2070508 RepID=UPI001E5F2729|nr:FBP domain-containing protein [Blastococcus atacamensis]